MFPNHPLVLLLPAAPFPISSNDDSQDDTGSELKKIKRMLTLQNGETTSFVVDGDEVNNVIVLGIWIGYIISKKNIHVCDVGYYVPTCFRHFYKMLDTMFQHPGTVQCA